MERRAGVRERGRGEGRPREIEDRCMGEGRSSRPFLLAGGVPGH